MRGRGGSKARQWGPWGAFVMKHFWVDTRANCPKFVCPQPTFSGEDVRQPVCPYQPLTPEPAQVSGRRAGSELRGRWPTAARLVGATAGRSRRHRAEEAPAKVSAGTAASQGLGSGKPCEPVSAPRSLREAPCRSPRGATGQPCSHTDTADRALAGRPSVPTGTPPPAPGWLRSCACFN